MLLLGPEASSLQGRLQGNLKMVINQHDGLGYQRIRTSMYFVFRFFDPIMKNVGS